MSPSQKQTPTGCLEPLIKMNKQILKNYTRTLLNVYQRKIYKTGAPVTISYLPYSDHKNNVHVCLCLTLSPLVRSGSGYRLAGYFITLPAY